MKKLLLGALLLTSVTSFAVETIDLRSLEDQARLGEPYKIRGNGYWQSGGTWSKGTFKKYAKVEAEKAAIQLCKSVNAYQVKIFDYKTFKHKYDSAHINYIVEVTAMCIF